MTIEQEYALFFHEDCVLLERQNHHFILPKHPLNPSLIDIAHNQPQLCVGEFANKKTHAILLEQTFTPQSAFILTPVRELLVTLANTEHAKFLCRAKQLLNWHKNTLFCGHCGNKTQIGSIEICKYCPQCNTTTYPSTSPAIIVLIQRDNHILLGRSPHFAPGMYSTLAGFVEAGESCEEAVVREVQEEVGIGVHNIRYFGSQSWPFPNSFMIGYLADYSTGEICINPNEIEDAQWFHPSNLPIIPPPYSIARQMIDLFLARN